MVVRTFEIGPQVDRVFQRINVAAGIDLSTQSQLMVDFQGFVPTFSVYTQHGGWFDSRSVRDCLFIILNGYDARFTLRCQQKYRTSNLGWELREEREGHIGERTEENDATIRADDNADGVELVKNTS
jgi:hypothetical protein